VNVYALSMVLVMEGGRSRCREKAERYLGLSNCIEMSWTPYLTCSKLSCSYQAVIEIAMGMGMETTLRS
jgi:hypothetical protein